MGRTRQTGNLVSNNQITVDISNQRVGIGSTLPSTTLDVSGNVNATSFNGSGTNLTGIVTSIVAGSNITISGSTGQVTINSTASGGGGTSTLDILEVMLFA